MCCKQTWWTDVAWYIVCMYVWATIATYLQWKTSGQIAKLEKICLHDEKQWMSHFVICGWGHRVCIMLPYEMCAGMNGWWAIGIEEWNSSVCMNKSGWKLQLNRKWEKEKMYYILYLSNTVGYTSPRCFESGCSLGIGTKKKKEENMWWNWKPFRGLREYGLGKRRIGVELTATCTYISYAARHDLLRKRVSSVCCTALWMRHCWWCFLYYSGCVI